MEKYSRQVQQYADYSGRTRRKEEQMEELRIMLMAPKCFYA
jgi:hypothetical protein